MTLSDKEKLKRLNETFTTNYKVASLYASYLSVHPEIITKEIIDELCGDTDITKKEAIVALLSEIFGLDDSNGGIERKIIRDYISPAVRLLDVKVYTENPYYKNVAPKDVRDGEWEFKWEYYPPYRAAVCDDVIFNEDFSEIVPLGFFDEGFHFPAVLENGNEWMTLTPVDVDTSTAAIEDAHGKVVTFGLGLGYYAYMVSEKDNVESVTVVEKSSKVIELFKKHVLKNFPNKEKINIVNCDAFEYAEQIMPNENFDYAFVDTWRDASDGAPMYERMKALEHLSPNTRFSYWIENFLISYIRAGRFARLWDSYTRGDSDAPKTYDEFIRRLTD